MFDADTHELLCLFATMIVADKKVYAVEIDSFIEAVPAFFEGIGDVPVPSHARLLMWFEINRENIKAKLSQDNFEEWFETLMDRVTRKYPVDAVIKVLNAISESDNEIHISEKALMALVKLHWPQVA